jgi:hypothetical protein
VRSGVNQSVATLLREVGPEEGLILTMGHTYDTQDVARWMGMSVPAALEARTALCGHYHVTPLEVDDYIKTKD